MKTAIKLLIVLFGILTITGCTEEIEVDRLDPNTIDWHKEVQEELLDELLKGREIEKLKGNEFYNANLLGFLISMQDYELNGDGFFISNASYFSIGEIAKIDINGDGQYDTISVTPITIDNSSSNMELKINEHVVQIYLDNPLQTYALIDIDKTDSYIQVFLSEEGPSNDHYSYIFTFDGSKIIASGKISGLASPNEADMSGVNDMNIDGLGNITVWERAKNLQTWFYMAKFSLDKDQLLYEHMPPEGHYITDSPVFMMQSLLVFKDKNTSSKTVTIEEGQPAHITATDNNQWIQITASDGTQGWAYLETPFGKIKNGIEWSKTVEVFYNLSFAD